MSHITTAPRTDRVAFNALPQSHTHNVSPERSDESYDNYNDYHNHTTQLHERQYDRADPTYERRHGLVRSSSGRSWPSRGVDYTQVSTGYKPDMINHSETTLVAMPEIDRERPNYKPSALRWPFLVILLLVVSALIGMVVWALKALPVLNNNLDILSSGNLKRDVEQVSSYTVVRIAFTDVRSIDTPSPLKNRADDSSESPASPTSEEDTTLTLFATPSENDFGHIGDQTITELAKPTTTPSPSKDTTSKSGITSAYLQPQENFGNIGDQTITEPAEPTTTSPPADDSSEPVPITVFSKSQENFGHLPVSVTITKTASTGVLIPGLSDYGDIGSKTISETTTKPDHHDDDGSTSMYASPPASNHGDIGKVTVSEIVTRSPSIVTPTFVTPTVTVITNSEGLTTTSTSIPEPISTPHTTTLTDSQGRPTATQETSVLVTPSIVTHTDSSGKPTATKTFFLPTLLALALAIPIRILDANAKLLQPWHALTHDRGAPGRKSLCLNTSGLRSLAGGQVLAFLTAALLIPVSAEAVKFDLRGVGCVAGSGDASNCAYVLGVFDHAAQATAALLGFMALALAAPLAVLARWRSGVGANPWSIGGAAALALSPDVRRLFTGLPAGVDAGKMPTEVLESVLEDRWFKLGYFYGPHGTVEYGVMLREDGHGKKYGLADGEEDNGDGEEPKDYPAVPTKPKHHLPFLMLGYIGRGLFLFILCGLLGLVIYYNTTGGDTAFERFMDGELFGVRFLFTTFGVVISFFWASFFSSRSSPLSFPPSIAILSPYQLLANSPQHARRSILLAPPTNAFSGLLSSVRQRHGFLAVVASTSILSEFLTIFLGNIPYRVTQTFLLHQVCTWAAVGILCIMVLVVGASFFITWPHMPVDPSTIAGAMYYICDSWMLSRFEGLSTLKRKDRDRRVNEMGLRYEFREIRGVARVGVDASLPSPGGMGWA
ncbi:uncharacterized protein F4812DRAFT_456046 [Daldinia caldariorum]|uniref:uncharacterized protein n=1 Tax=Daldinia caldariorum TaxID=326644 RepID=UPI0020086BB3|nr:uncharacterized protein F4812DRAFT_456046 [Daldinia caldariorum]KAI1471943.1 hypothetical protein F4812DRAFT_456046 [Daldinia caldariorum]